MFWRTCSRHECQHVWQGGPCASLTACTDVGCRRDHAQIIAEDKDLTDIFTKWCYMEWRDNNWRDCYSDEHYLGTLLASKVVIPWQLASESTAGLIFRSAPC